jgi:hypothetical protein
VSDKPKGNPNPNYGKPARLVKMEKGVPTTPVTVTPLEMPTEDEEHWLDVNHAAYDRIKARLAEHGIDNPFKPSDIASRTTEIRMADALLTIIGKLKT